MKMSKESKADDYITKDKSLVISFPFYGKDYELCVGLEQCIKGTDSKTFWASYTFNDVLCPNVDFETNMITFFITMDAIENHPSIRNLEIIAYWEDTYDVGEFIDEYINCSWSNDSQNTWKQKNIYRGEVDRLGIDVPWHLLCSFIH